MLFKKFILGIVACAAFSFASAFADGTLSGVVRRDLRTQRVSYDVQLKLSNVDYRMVGDTTRDGIVQRFEWVSVWETIATKQSWKTERLQNRARAVKKGSLFYFNSNSVLAGVPITGPVGSGQAAVLAFAHPYHNQLFEEHPLEENVRAAKTNLEVGFLHVKGWQKTERNIQFEYPTIYDSISGVFMPVQLPHVESETSHIRWHVRELAPNVVRDARKLLALVQIGFLER